MSQASSAALAGNTEDSTIEAPACVSLKGTTWGLEILISGTPSAAALGARLTELLAEAPGFFAGSTARVAVDGALPVGALACLEDVATRFELRIVEIGPAGARRGRLESTAVPRETAGGSSRGESRPVKLVEETGPIAGEAGPRGDDPGGCALGEVRPVPPASAAEIGRSTAANESSSNEGPRDAPAGASASDAVEVDAACKAASTPNAPSDAACKAAPAPGPGDAACKVAPASGLVDVACKAASAPDAPSEAACKAASAPDAPSEAACKAASASGSSDPGLVAALAAVLAAAGRGQGAVAPGEEPAGPRLVVGPVRSGRIVDHVGHLIVVGDVNPGAEVRAEGSIIVLGRLRGVAHAAIGRDAGCIIALSLQPQQLRIGRMVARAGDADRPSGGAEIAYATGETIVVERFLGRLPSGLAASM